MTSIEKDLSLNLKIQPTSFLKKRIEELAGLVLLAFMALLSVAFLLITLPMRPGTRQALQRLSISWVYPEQ